MLDLSISIVNWNTRDLLRNCLRSIYETTHQISYEIFVVDNASSDGSYQMIEREFPQVRLLRNEENLGFAQANNQALKRSQGRYILLLNPDTIVLERAFAKMVEFMDGNPKVGALGPRILNEDRSLQFSCYSFPTISTFLFHITHLDTLFPKNRLMGKYRMSYWDHNDIREVDWVTGACLMVRQEVIQRIGLLDEDYFMFSEDLDWCYRIKRLGWKVYYLPKAEVIHLRSQATQRDRERMETATHITRLLFFSKHYDVLRVSAIKCLLILEILIKTPLLIIFSLFPTKRKSLRSKINRYKNLLKLIF